MRFIGKDYVKVCKWLSFILPLIGTLYFALSEIWGFPYATEIVGTIAALTAFLMAVVGFAKPEDTPKIEE